MKIKTQLFLLFLAVSVLLTGSFAFTVYYFTREVVLRQVNAQLDSVAETKASQVRSMVANIHELSSFLSRNQEIGQRMGALRGDRNPRLQQDLSAHLSGYVIDILQFKQITLLDTMGIVIASSDASLNGRNLAGTAAYRQGKTGKNQVIGFFYDSDDNYRLKASDLMFDERNGWIGIVVIDLDADPFLELVNDYTGLDRTGETNMATAVADYGLYVTPLKFDRNAALRRKIELHAPQLAMSLALNGQTGLQEEVQDYTGQAVIASTRYLPDTGWGMVTKIDRQEALSGVHALQQLLLLISLAGIAVAVVAKVGFSKQATHYLFSVRDNGRGIAEADLDRVFGLFEKAHPGTVGSTGIGLSIVKRIVEENNGKTWVESEVGVGSTFYFTVPLT